MAQVSEFFATFSLHVVKLLMSAKSRRSLQDGRSLVRCGKVQGGFFSRVSFPRSRSRAGCCISSSFSIKSTYEAHARDANTA